MLDDVKQGDYVVPLRPEGLQPEPEVVHHERARGCPRRGLKDAGKVAVDASDSPPSSSQVGGD